MSRGVRSSRPGEPRGPLDPNAPDDARTPEAHDPHLPVAEDAGAASDEATAPPNAAPATLAAEETAAELKDRWLRTEADLQNYRRRARRDVEEARRDSEERVMLEMISAIDDIERAVRAGRDAGAPESWLKGVELVANRLREYLGRNGVHVIEPLGQPFDPSFHEALLEIDAPPGSAPGSVVDVALKGYRRGDRVLRAARVVVARPGGEAASVDQG
ncbi:MAG TPA: nucleotide exchange factor GrpE [Candidatus Udaeobacter sp.]|jgi:molecular chaperone GrpE|nr:nucleotide exchange factor GrpE [Candidatus Udaeobacter sp.]